MAAHLLRREAGVARVLLARNAVTNAVKKLPVIANIKVQFSECSHRHVGLRRFSASTSSQQTDKSQTTSENVDNEDESSAVVPADTDDKYYRERYIPVTRSSVVRRLLELDGLNAEEKKIYKNMAAGIDSAIVNRYYHGLLQELKSLFDPINPDKDTIQTRSWNRQERLENEFWLIQRLDDVAEKANFHELPHHLLQNAMKEHDVNIGVTVEVDPEKFDVLKIWALGKTLPKQDNSFYKRIIKAVGLGADTDSSKEYKRVVIALRQKKDQKLMLKSFKDVPIKSLEMLLPGTKIKMRKFDKMVFSAMAFISLGGLIAKAVTYKAHLVVNSTLGVAAIAALVACQASLRYYNKRSLYLGQLNSFLYNKNIANNRGLLALIVDRAEDESFKEALLTYTFLLTSRENRVKNKPQSAMNPKELGGLTVEELENAVESWIKEVSGTDVEFHSSEAINMLKDFGILSEFDSKLFVLSVESATRVLPQQPHRALMKLEESDLSEGYDNYEDQLEILKRQAEEEKDSSWWFKFGNMRKNLGKFGS